MANRIVRMLGLDSEQPEDTRAHLRAQKVKETHDALVGAGFSREEAIALMSGDGK